MFSSNTSSAAGDAVFVEDVFSTSLYTGNGSSQTITNGVDLSGKGGLVWIKARSDTTDHYLHDSARSWGTGGELSTNNTAPAGNAGYFNVASTGFSLPSSTFNDSGTTYASWTFREQPKFFDVVTYTGTGSNRTIAHNLGSVPGCIIVKRLDSTSEWYVYHRALTSAAYGIELNNTGAQSLDTTLWNSTAPTNLVFSLGTSGGINASGGTYVAYLFAHDAGGFGLTGTDNVISCGSVTTNGSGVGSVNLGWEPQWVLAKVTNTTNDWRIIDNMRGFTATYIANGSLALRPNTSGAESDASYFCNSTGFTFDAGASQTFIYIAIRRGPMKVPTSGTSVFKPQVITANGAINAGFPSDATLTAVETSSRPWPSRFSGGRPVFTNNTNAESGSSFYNYGFSQNSYDYTFGTGTESRATLYDLRRAPSFFDEVCYTGNSISTGSQTLNHNLGAAPEMIITKRRNDTSNWAVMHKLDFTKTLYLEGTVAWQAYQTTDTQTSTQFNVINNALNMNLSGATYVAYLFATCPGVSKVGSYTGNGSSQTINCGFTGGARFVMIKRTDNTGDWYVWDTARGIVSGNDPHLSLNTTAAEVTSNDTIDTDSTGFVVNQVSATNVNVSSATYIFLAIA
jgi:hypothetical protein